MSSTRLSAKAVANCSRERFTISVWSHGGIGISVFSFHLGEALTNLLTAGAVDAGVGHLPLPADQELIVLSQTGKGSPFQDVVPAGRTRTLDVPDAAFDLPFVPWRVRSGGQDYEVVMPGKGDDLRLPFGIEPVGLLHCRHVLKFEGRGRLQMSHRIFVLDTARTRSG